MSKEQEREDENEFELHVGRRSSNFRETEMVVLDESKVSRSSTTNFSQNKNVPEIELPPRRKNHKPKARESLRVTSSIEEEAFTSLNNSTRKKFIRDGENLSQSGRKRKELSNATFSTDGVDLASCEEIQIFSPVITASRTLIIDLIKNHINTTNKFDLREFDVLNIYTDAEGFINCPVPGCEAPKKKNIQGM
ncbi:hypothetical protein HK096_010936, partial [Nowakowskiella sp. JEL0078]